MGFKPCGDPKVSQRLVHYGLNYSVSTNSADSSFAILTFIRGSRDGLRSINRELVRLRLAHTFCHTRMIQMRVAPTLHADGQTQIS